MEWLQEGTHLGTLDVKEADPRAFLKCDPVVDNVRPFGGLDLIHDFVLGGEGPKSCGTITNVRASEIDWTNVTELGEVLIDTAKGRKTLSAITHHCNNIGLGMQFAAVGAKILEKAKERQLGRNLATNWFLQKEHT